MKEIKRWNNEEQEWFVKRGAAPTLLVGGINSGKTVGGVLKSLIILNEYPGSRMAVVRRSYTQLLKTTMETWYQWCLPQMYDPKKGGKRTEQVLTLVNNSKVYFIHLDQPNSLDLLAGLELNFAYISQVEEISETAFDLLDVRVGRWTGATIPEHKFAEVGGRENWRWKSKSGDCIPPRYLFAEGYVTDEGHWLYDRFAPESPNREKWARLGYESKISYTEKSYYAIQATVDAALSKDEEYIRKFVRPTWGNPEGKIFKIDPASILEPEPWLVEKIVRSMKLHRSLDHGETAPTCCLWHGTDYDGNIFVYREYYEPDKNISEHRQHIFDLSKPDFPSGEIRYYSNLADPTIVRDDRGRTATSKPEWSVSDDYCDTRIMPKETAIYWTASENDEVVTRSRMKEYLKVDPTHRNPITGKMGAPRIYFIKKGPDYPNGCQKVISETRSQQRVKAKIGDREVWLDKRDESVVDHAYDCCKYFVVNRPSLGPQIVIDDLQPGEMRLTDYDAAANAIRSRKKLMERRIGVAALGYGER